MDLKFIVIRSDADGANEKRAAWLDEHRSYMRGLQSRFILGGPLFDPDISEDAAEVLGGCMIVEAEGMNEVQEIIANDPFTALGVFQTVEIFRYGIVRRDDL